MKILLKFPSRSRPDKFKQCIDNIRKNIAEKENYHILVSADEDDKQMMAMFPKDYFAETEDVTMVFGNSISKIDAVNRDINEYKGDWDIIVATSDDMWFMKKGFDDIIRQDMRENFPDLDGVLHYNDGNQRGNVMTLSIMGRKYYERTNYIYHPDYISLWSDMEATEVARLLGKYKYFGDDKILFKHFHPAWGLAHYDEQYKKSESKEMWEKDEAVYKYRKSNNFFLNA